MFKKAVFPFKILGIESSCDECSVAIVEFHSPLDIKTLSLKTFSQIDLHSPFGGVVPEIASRNHLETIQPLLDEALLEAQLKMTDIDALSVTTHPGLMGALLVGVTAAKALAYCFSKPLISVNHLEGHCLSFLIEQKDNLEKLEYPLLIALVSGGHTQLYHFESPPELWKTDELKNSLVAFSRDDAAGEAFDKTAKLMGFPYPGGKYIDEAAKKGDPRSFSLPRALPQKSLLEFSFSGLKTATHQLITKLKKEGQFESNISNIAASVQEAIIDMLLNKTFLALKKYKSKSLVFVGGVAANSRLKDRILKECPILFFIPHLKYCTDNAAMIATAGGFHYLKGNVLNKNNALILSANPTQSYSIT